MRIEIHLESSSIYIYINICILCSIVSYLYYSSFHTRLQIEFRSASKYENEKSNMNMRTLGTLNGRALTWTDMGTHTYMVYIHTYIVGL